MELTLSGLREECAADPTSVHLRRLPGAPQAQGLNPETRRTPEELARSTGPALLMCCSLGLLSWSTFLNVAFGSEVPEPPRVWTNQLEGFKVQRLYLLILFSLYLRAISRGHCIVHKLVGFLILNLCFYAILLLASNFLFDGCCVVLVIILLTGYPGLNTYLVGPVEMQQAGRGAEEATVDVKFTDVTNALIACKVPEDLFTEEHRKKRRESCWNEPMWGSGDRGPLGLRGSGLRTLLGLRGSGLRTPRSEGFWSKDSPRSEGFWSEDSGDSPRSEGFWSEDSPRSVGFWSEDSGDSPPSEGFWSEGFWSKDSPRSVGFWSEDSSV
ncbi:hypothetical protein EYF80_055726 [Liparis tanakae]|uniref:Uncharacterized protein n=1 Tax=Liparis tanakae TaxID=230148 RepID=A0A4Z2EZB2_9TELE|nr:hypothetical protein EYF80_055726 [Liparis tanakae]